MESKQTPVLLKTDERSILLEACGIEGLKISVFMRWASLKMAKKIIKENVENHN